MVGRGCIMNLSLQPPCICLGFPISMTSVHVRKTLSPQSSEYRGHHAHGAGARSPSAFEELGSVKREWTITPHHPPSSLGCPGARLSLNEPAAWLATWHSPFGAEASEPPCTDGDTEAQNVEVTSPRPHSKSGTKPELGPPSDLNKTSRSRPCQMLIMG